MRIAVIGGDLRMLSVCRLFSKQGYSCTLWGFESMASSVSELNCQKDIGTALKGADAAVLPLPFCKGGKLYAPFSGAAESAEAVLELCEGQCFVLGGGIGKIKNGFDYSNSEPLLIKNAQITAEAALSIAMSELKTTVFGSNVLITGFGRIAKFLAELCLHLGASVSVLARRPEALALAEAMGCKAFGFEKAERAISEADIIFNTVPAPILQERELGAVNKHCRIIELASAPGGIHRALAKKMGLTVVEALGLPGKYAPISAGKAIFETVLPILHERGIKA